MVNNGLKRDCLPLPEGIRQLLAKGVEEGVFAGASVGIVSGTVDKRQQWQGFYGNRQLIPSPLPLTEDTFYDLASLTKPLATTLAILSLINDGLLDLEAKLPELLSCSVPAAKKDITLRQLLSHSSGLAAHHPFYLQLKDLPPDSRKAAMLDLIMADPLLAQPGSKAVYSDLGFMLLGWIVEEKSGVSLDGFVRERIYRPLALEEKLFFRPLTEKWSSARNVAATEQCPWRGKVLVGEVSDDNCHVLGGVAGQAGLFGNLQAVMTLTTFLLDCWQGRARHPAFSNELLAGFLKKDGQVPGSSWALGFDTPSPQGSSAGKYFHPASVGHLGFSGTSFWIDPQRDLVVVLLTNRVHPRRDNNGIKAFRPLFHDAVIETLGG